MDMIERDPKWSALHDAAWRRDVDEVDRLLKNGHNCNARSPAKKYATLHISAHLGHDEAIRKLIADAACVNVRDHDGQTPLHHAIDGGHKKTARLLLDNGASPTIMDVYGLTPRTLAIKLGCLEYLDLFDGYVIRAPPLGKTDPVSRPLGPEKGKKSQVCKDFKALLVSLHEVDTNKPQSMKVSRPTVEELLYGDALKHTKAEGVVTWINLPANNTEWVNDLVQTLYADQHLSFDRYQTTQRFVDDNFHKMGNRVLYRQARFSSQSSCTRLCSVVVPIIDVDVLLKDIAVRYTDSDTDSTAPRSTVGPMTYEDYNKRRNRDLKEAYGDCVYLPRTMNDFTDDAELSEHGAKSAMGGVIARYIDITRNGTNSASKTPDDSCPDYAIVVPQLWLWQITDNVILTAFPEKNDPGSPDNLMETVLGSVANEILNYCTWGSGHNLLEYFMLACVDHVDKRFTGGSENYTIRGAFAKLISCVASNARVSYQEFIGQDGQGSGSIPQDIRKNTIDLLQIDAILRELTTVKRMLIDQAQVINKFKQHSVKWDNLLRRYKAEAAEVQFDPQRPEEFRHPCLEVFDRLEEDAVQVRRSIASLLDLMQKEATIDEANASRFQSFVIFVFTAVTLVFAPLSFAVTLLSLNIDGFADAYEAGWVVEVSGLTLLATAALVTVPSCWYWVHWRQKLDKFRGSMNNKNKGYLAKKESEFDDRSETRLGQSSRAASSHGSEKGYSKATPTTTRSVLLLPSDEEIGQVGSEKRHRQTSFWNRLHRFMVRDRFMVR